MKYKKIVPAIFIDRPNRFIANVKIGQEHIETVHVKNTGRCRELLMPGAQVYLEESDNPNRKTKYDLVTVYKEGLGMVNMDSQAPNKVVGEWLGAYSEITYIKPEYKYGESRIDFYFETEKQMFQDKQKHPNKQIHLYKQKHLMEVKGVTLEREHVAYFPDAPTERGVRHIEELIKARDEGYECYLAFVIQMEGIDEVRPNMETHPAFGEAMNRAKAAGVHILALCCKVGDDSLAIDRVNQL